MMATVAANPVAKAENTDEEREASNLLPMRPIDDRAPEAIGLVEDQSKDGSYKPRYPTRRKRQER